MSWSSIQKKFLGFDRDLRLLLLSMSSRRIVMGFTQVVVTIYFALIGLSPISIGLLLSFSSAISALHHISFGVLSDRYGRKFFLLLGAIFATLRLVILATTRNFWLLAAGQGFGAMGEGAGAGQPVVSGYISDKVEIKNRVKVFSTIAITNTIAATIGSTIAGLPQIFQRLLSLDLAKAHVPLFIIGAFLSALSLLLLLPITDVKTVKTKNEQRKPFKIKSWNMILKFSIVRSTNGLAWGFIQSLLPLYFFLSFNVGSDVLGPIYAISRIISTVSFMFIPLVVDRLGEIGAITFFRVLSGAVTTAFALTKQYLLAVSLLVAFRVLMEITMPIRQSFATSIVDQDETATAIGVSSFARMGVRTIAPGLAGYMFEALSLSLPFILGSGLSILNGVLYFAFFRNPSSTRAQGE